MDPLNVTLRATLRGSVGHVQWALAPTLKSTLPSPHPHRSDGGGDGDGGSGAERGDRRGASGGGPSRGGVEAQVLRMPTPSSEVSAKATLSPSSVATSVSAFTSRLGFVHSQEN